MSGHTLLVTRERTHPQNMSVVLEHGRVYLMHDGQLVRPGADAVIETLSNVLMSCGNMDIIQQVTEQLQQLGIIHLSLF